MRVKNVVIDGFKSYAHRQELANLDHHFNAITGLNGSGKSNVFDAICYVMGLRNISKARVERQEELIFKNGKAGISRAAVTIEFDNSDPSNCHPEFPSGQFPEITVTRQIDTGLRQRFFLNGRLCDHDRIRDFFMKASLNIENPHFLVQQGQIHRLIGMKPADILGFIEEAAGTSIFDMSRRRAEQQMKNKNRRLEEINSSINEEINPMLEKIQKQEDENKKLEEIEHSIGRLRNFKAAHELYDAQRKAGEAKTKFDTVNNRILDLKQEEKEVLKTIAEKEARVAKLDEDMVEPTSTVEQYEAEVATLKASLTRVRTALTGSQKQCAAVEKELQKSEADFAKAKEKFENFNSNTEDTIKRHEDLKTQIDDTQEEILKLNQSLRLQKGGITAGLGGVGLMEEKSTLQSKLGQIEGDLKRKKVDLTTFDSQINERRREQDNLKQQFQTREKHLERARADLQAAEDAYRPHEAARKRAEDVKGSINQYYEKAGDLYRTITRDYAMCVPLKYDPQRVGNIGENPIHGRIAQLAQAKDENHSFALSVGGGFQPLLRVVVNNDVTSQRIVESGTLAQRTSFMPLNTCHPFNQNQRNILDNKLAAARQLASDLDGGNGWAELALNLIDYDPQYQAVMEKIFGNFLICSSVAVAKRVAYDDNCKLKAVSLDGDTIEPSGVMTGGSRGNLTDLLRTFAQARPLLDAFNEANENHKQAQRDLQHHQQNADKIRQLSDAVERCRAQVENLEHQQKNSRFAEVERSIEEIINRRQKLESDIQKVPERIEGIKLRLEEISKVENMDSDSIVKDLQSKIDAAKKKLVACKKELDSGTASAQKESDQKDKLQGEMEAKGSTLKEKKADLAMFRAEEAKHTEEAQNTDQTYQQRQALLKSAKQKLVALKNEHATISKELDAAGEEKGQIEEALMKSTTEQAEVQRIFEGASNELKHIEKSSAINSFMTPAIRASLGDVNGDYYFEDEARTQETLHRLAEAENLIVALSKKVDRNQIATYEQRKAENRKLIEQRDALIEDKNNIISSVFGIEEKKWKTLDDMTHEVSSHFSKLFNTCLNYATCRLQEKRNPETNLLEGLEVKVAFNGKEKSGLTELSGGQRSLLALCLILAVLKVHKAPIYILDEVDAALDPSHTQNLGKMLKEHFADAQFLLVSLKDGMFSSANVIYEVRNTQGFSEVTRKANRK